MNSFSNITLSRFVASDLEYLFIQLRSLFDNLQIIIKLIFKDIKFTDKDIKKKELPDSFSKIVYKNNKSKNGILRTRDEIIEKYPMPILFAEAYVNFGLFYKNIREIRDSIVHDGKNCGFIFSINKQFGLSIETELFRLYSNAVFIKDLKKAEAYVKKIARPGDLVVSMGAGDIYKVSYSINGRSFPSST
ncbi:MAG: hypothetical protein P9M03_08540 [Candidatus Theseobacter exili]|nr:hypothetical protein [Candidatus Theseobacter exili]